MDIIYKFISNPIVTLIIGFLGSYVFYILSRKRAKLKWCIKTANLINKSASKYNNLNIKYKDNNVDTISVSKIMFWNSGELSISGQDFSKDNPIKIVSAKDGITLLESNVIASNDTEVKAIPNDKNEILLQFEYLNPKKGAVIEIIHNGTSSRDIKIDGKAKDVKEIERGLSSGVNYFHTFRLGRRLENKLKPRKVAIINSIIRILVSIVCILLGLFSLIVDIAIIVSKKNKDISMYFLFVSFIILGACCIILGIINLKTDIPKGLESFQDEIID